MKQKQLFRETDGVRGKANFPPLDTETVLRLGKSLSEYLKRKVEPNPNRGYKVVIGKDTRRSGYLLEQTLTAGFLSRGVDVITVGPMPTPAISHLVKSFALDMGVMITASHNPYYDNGIKVFNSNGHKLTDNEELEIEAIYFENGFNGSELIGRAQRIEDVSGRYIEYIKHAVNNTSLKGLTIVVDCANGASYKTAPIVFQELGAKVIPINIEPNGYNINVECGSLYPEKVKDAVLKNKADLGIALDGDADRVIMIDEKGNEIDGNYITALMAKNLKETGNLNKNTVVTTEYSNLALDLELAKHDIKVLKVVNGDRAITELCRQKGLNFGGEFTGHFIFLDYADTGDGTMTALQVLKIIKEKGKKLSELAYTFEKFPQRVFNVEVKEKLPLEEIKSLQEKIKDWKEKFAGKGRVFLRYSGTENLLRIMIEAENMNFVEKAGKDLMAAAQSELS
jgi:phosphoglucosamine mutase